MDRRHFLKLGIGVASFRLLQGCGSEAEPTLENPLETPDATQEEMEVAESHPPLRIALSSPPNGLDPAQFVTIEEYQFGFMIYEGLIWVDHELTPQPMLAEQWETAQDGLSWLFQLRRDVTFHHGTPFTAQDVVYTFERLLDPAIGSSLRPLLSFVETVEAIDDHTVRFTLNAVNMDLLLLLGAAQARIIASDYSSPLLASAPSGTGPFQIENVVAGQYVSFVRNSDYWNIKRLHLQEVHHVYITSLDDQVTALIAGEIDLIPDFASTYLEQLNEHPEIEVLETLSGAYQTIVMQATKAPFDDIRVRQALKYCIDRPTVRSQVLQGRGSIGNDHPIAAINPFWADLPVRSTDIEQARQLLAAAGYVDGLHLDLITSTARPGMLELANAFREMAARAGIVINVIEVPADIYWTDYWGKVPFHTGTWSFRPSIDETLMLAYHSTSIWNTGKWLEPQLDLWIDEARAELDQEKRKRLYQQIQQLIMEDGATIIPYFRAVLTAARKHVQGFVPHPAGWLSLWDVTIR